MNFSDIFNSLQNYVPCRRSYWAPNTYVQRSKETDPQTTILDLVKINGNANYVISKDYHLSMTDIFATDWEN